MLVVFAVLLGERQGRFGNLQNDLAEGKISSVTVRGEGLLRNETGSVLQTVVWEGGWGITRQDDVRVTTDEDGSGSTSSGPVLSGERDLADYLRRTYPDLTVNTEWDRSSESSILGFRHLPSGLGLALLVVNLVVLLRIVIDRHAWRATRWAWFWAWMFVSPVAVPLFLLLSGPTPFVPAPRNPDRRLTGGWALLLCLFVPGIVSATWAARSW
ncbi:hypothetical protein KIH74_13460 [Kineosporia sp. J2-2]|uniref:DUF4436 domain-containing protein n=1 Tax=Kineosporia corallincola TaxID=2835133 RepID=A0ABS5TFS3_9ACTN|nr:hypothetical protein [Kineosporia corallincola]MBT0769939.1 hypothetical protein [Kineosporia corallincola]